MKLYTEEQVIKLINWEVPTVVSLEELREIVNFDLTPIELPSDEDLEKARKENRLTMEEMCRFEEGVEWLIERINNQNK